MSSMDKTQFSILEVKTQILENEARAAALLRERLRKEGILFVNLMASPGAGKTTTHPGQDHRGSWEPVPDRCDRS